MSVIIYCKDHYRRPVRFASIPLFRDVQSEIPSGWCDVCGCEIFTPGEDRCILCRQRKEKQYE